MDKERNWKLCRPVIIDTRIRSLRALRDWEQLYDRALDIDQDDIHIAALTRCEVMTIKEWIASHDSQPQEKNPDRTNRENAQSPEVDTESGEYDDRTSGSDHSNALDKPFYDPSQDENIEIYGPLRIEEPESGRVGTYFIPFEGIWEAATEGRVRTLVRRCLVVYTYFHANPSEIDNLRKEKIIVSGDFTDAEVVMHEEYRVVRDSICCCRTVHGLYGHEYDACADSKMPFYEIDTKGREVFDLPTIYGMCLCSLPSYIKHQLKDSWWGKILLEFSWHRSGSRE